jgi:hypothetical protein
MYDGLLCMLIKRGIPLEVHAEYDLLSILDNADEDLSSPWLDPYSRRFEHMNTVTTATNRRL